MAPRSSSSEVLLDRFTVRPGHLDRWEALRAADEAVLAAQGLRVLRTFVETDAEPKVTRLLTPSSAVGDVPGHPAEVREHVFGNRVVRPVRAELLGDGVTDRTVVMRRYSIVGEWADFLAIWRRIVPVRERHGFEVLFAVADEAKDLFTWAFAMDASWEDFGAAQRGYYRDPERVELRGVFDHMADYSLHPARELPPLP